ncbi:L,D-transpeptidase [Rhizobiales bacterium]|uniref:L,D-transpeptidase n=1 Tax=Hongsoonwoonella zoysiae TaxID=2821844 RepID=UPI0015605989|nr:L,D-transpeptidase [Hongsoonwoonella zoysiae]NRG18090.1 L,D-transpeptidase [Hongsoonwoonella zoysiae]
MQGEARRAGLPPGQAIRRGRSKPFTRPFRIWRICSATSLQPFENRTVSCRLAPRIRTNPRIPFQPYLWVHHLAGGQYAIHGTNRPRSISRAVSYGCIRMPNEDISDLFGRVKVRTPVIAVN